MVKKWGMGDCKIVLDRTEILITIILAKQLTVFDRKLNCGGNMIRKVLFVFVLIVCFGLVAEEGDERITAEKIIRTMTETLNPEQSDAVMEMTIVTSGNQERTFVYKAYSKKR